MAKPASLFKAPGFSFSSGTLNIKHGENVAIDEANDGTWSYSLGNNDYTLTVAQVDSINRINIGDSTNLALSADALDGENFRLTGNGNLNVPGVVFQEASDAASFEPNTNIDFVQFNSTGSLEVNGDEGKYFALLWDKYDDALGYLNGLGGDFQQALFGNVGGEGGGYATTATVLNPSQALGYVNAGNAAYAIITGFAELGVEYVRYLERGGEAVDYLTVKANSSGRDQTLHDNLLGNVNGSSLDGRNYYLFNPDAYDGSTSTNDLQGLGYANYVPGDWEARPYYDGNLSTDGTDQLASVTFDTAHGVERDGVFG